jgi:hypothetical protein
VRRFFVGPGSVAMTRPPPAPALGGSQRPGLAANRRGYPDNAVSNSPSLLCHDPTVKQRCSTSGDDSRLKQPAL